MDDGLRVLLLRAVNVGGAKLPMAELRELAEGLGATRVSTYIASGNLLCVPPGDWREFDRALERAVEQRFGFFREVVSRTPAELQRALDAHPFEVLHPRFSSIVFLTGHPAAEVVERARQVDTGPELWRLVGEEVHVRYADGAGRAHPGLDRALRTLGVPGTARNLSTVRKLVDLCRAG
ncbi:DUF1697 domain-containing protein [Auraticoccus sp. F435]|uniref:DUF1697 domain-containing protein n=1 Tax=Auraticoccus cholistanensis TaxID=2656650 RepID=A0A6A9UU73_9ACTN|nr:DUF1697 domain-containing protein [Auraticoccus cholistanensis]MVA75285.1 DUF1697 domain-containing protein [Auraticoccus cholistanensis]